jgi:hypothetical protein
MQKMKGLEVFLYTCIIASYQTLTMRHAFPDFHEHEVKAQHVVYQYNNNNQAFYSQASWGRLEMKPHELKKTRAKKKGKIKGDKKTK